MLCDHCHKHEASIFIREHGPNGQHSLNLCQKCAVRQFLDVQDGHLHNFLGNISKLLASIDHDDMDKPLLSLPGFSGLRRPCPHCNRRQSELEDTWELGCAECATTFQALIDRRLHALGRVWPLTDAKPQPYTPPNIDQKEEIARLTAELRQAVRREEYERAAILRDQLKALKAEDKG
ncbi:MAG TPA: UvrB/UvrC motif-containing protein [Lentisphaeria bacterium]|nr:UvrB/UvrC motif-containing protein [Lentisphaeria bacterium]